METYFNQKGALQNHPVELVIASPAVLCTDQRHPLQVFRDMVYTSKFPLTTSLSQAQARDSDMRLSMNV